MKTGVCFTALMALLGFTAVGSASPRATALIPSSIVIPVDSPRRLPVYVAADKGFWRAQGLDVKLSVVKGAAATNAVIAGSVDFANTGSLEMIRAVIAGQPLVAIGLIKSEISHQIVLRHDVAAKLHLAPGAAVESRARALAGLTIAVDSIGSQPDGYLRYVLGRAGLDPDRAVRVTPVQPPAMMSALEAKAVDGFVFSKPWTTMAVRKVGAVLWLNSEDDPQLRPFADSVIITRPQLCKEKPRVCRGIIAGLEQAIAYIRSDPEGAKAVLRHRFERLDETTIDHAIPDALKAVGKTLVVSKQAFQNAENFLVVSGLLPADKKIDVTKLYTNEYQP